MKPGRIVGAGLLAGLVSNVSGIVLGHFVLGQEYVEAFSRHLPAPPDAAMLLLHLSMRFGFGLLVAFLYFAVQPRFRAGLPATTVAGLTFFVAVQLPLALTLQQFGILTGWRLAVTLPWGLAESGLMALVARWLLR